MNGSVSSPDRASGGAKVSTPERSPANDSAFKKPLADRKTVAGSSSASPPTTGSTAAPSPASTHGRAVSSGSSEGGRIPSPRSSAVDPNSSQDRTRAGNAEAAAGGSSSGSSGQRQKPSRQRESSRINHRRSASDGDPTGAAAALEERRRQRLLKVRQFQSMQGVGTYQLEGGAVPPDGEVAPPEGRATSVSAMASSADAAAVGFDPGAAPSSRGKGQHRQRRHHRQNHRRTRTMPELPTHTEGVPSPATPPVQQAQAHGYHVAGHPQGYGTPPQAHATAQYYPQGPHPKQLFHSPQSQAGHFPANQDPSLVVAAAQSGAGDLAGHPVTPSRRKGSRRTSRRKKTLSDPSGRLFQSPPGQGQPGGALLPPVSPGSNSRQDEASPYPPTLPPAPGSGGTGGPPLPRPRMRGRSSSYSVGDTRQQQGSSAVPGGGPIQPQLKDFSARTEFLALSKPLSASQRRLVMGQDVSPPASPGSGPGGRPSLAVIGKAQSWAVPRSPGGQLEVIGAPTTSPGGRPSLATVGKAHSWAVPHSPRGQLEVIGAGVTPRSPVRASSSRRANSFDVGGTRGLSPLREHTALSMGDMQMPHIPVVPHLQDEGDPLLENGGHRVYTAPDSGEGEPFLSENFSRASPRRHSSHRRGSSVRKMHMRQHSVQIFMEDVRGHVQPKRCHDTFFAIFFLLQLALMVAIGVKFGSEAIRANSVIVEGEEDTGGLHVTYRNVILVACMCGAFAATLSALALVVMTLIARRLVQVALVFSIAMSFVWGTVGIGLSPKSFVPITGIIALMLSVGYTFVVWDRIPFAAANLRTALSGIRSNLGAVALAFWFQTLALGWSIYYTFAVIGLYDAIENGDVNVESQVAKVFIYVALGVAYYWTFQVIVHTVQATVSGTIAEWWFVSESEVKCCSPALCDSFFRSSFFSFGSICLGSLLVGPVQILRQIAENFRPNRDNNVLMCLHECLVCFSACAVGCVDRLAEMFHPWAFTYVGMYGYGFGEAGKRATELFRKRGWTTIVTDDLIPNVLFIASLVIGGVTGCFGLLLEALDDFGFTSLDNPVVTSFVIGLAVGLVLSSVLFSIISASVHAVIVCFAASPVEFQQNHPDLSNEMRSAWREVWPGCMDIVDVNIGIGAALGMGSGGAGGGPMV